MAKIRFLFLQLLFLVAPLLYAWFYIPGIEGDLSDIVSFFFPDLHWSWSYFPTLEGAFSGLVSFFFPDLRWSWFENVKVMFFLVCTGGALIFHLGHILSQEKPADFSQDFLIALGTFFAWTAASLWINYDSNPYFAWGNPEKHHGWFFSIALFALFFLLKTLSSAERKRLVILSCISLGGVVLYAVFQKIGLDPLAPFYQTRIDTHRIFSTLGNPNYLAGFVLVMLPLLQEVIALGWEKFQTLRNVILCLLAGILVYWTGSYMAWIVFSFYMLIIALRYVIPDKSDRYRIWIVGIAIGIIGFVFFWREYGTDVLEMQKMKWFIARWYLWKTGFAAITHDIGHFLFWYGPDGFLPVSEYFRHPLLSIYEDPAYRIDRSHNVFIDIALHFWVPVLILLSWLTIRNLRYLTSGGRMSLLLFSLYFFFNIPVLVHFLIVTLVVTSHRKLVSQG